MTVPLALNLSSSPIYFGRLSSLFDERTPRFCNKELERVGEEVDWNDICESCVQNRRIDCDLSLFGVISFRCSPAVRRVSLDISQAAICHAVGERPRHQWLLPCDEIASLTPN